MVQGPGRDLAEAGHCTAMRAFLDTNILVRHLTGDPPTQAKRATAFLGSDHELILARVTGGRLLGEGQPMVHIRKSAMHY